MQFRCLRPGVILSSVLVAGLAWSAPAIAADHVKGVISARGADSTVTVRADDATELTVTLTDATKVRRVDGARTLKVGADSLIPGLRVHLTGTRDGGSGFVAQRIEFSRSDMKTALAIRSGVDPTDLRSLDNQRRITENERILAQQKQTLARQAQDIATNRDTIAANETRMVATTGEINNRISNLDDYNVVSTVTVYFRNGKSGIESQYKAQLQQLAAQAKDVKGYLIQIQGYASAVGPNVLNQKLSARRADAVTAELQQGGVPLPSIVVPAAMGVSDQVATNKTTKGQAENRRTVVTLLQSKGVSGQ